MNKVFYYIQSISISNKIISKNIKRANKLLANIIYPIYFNIRRMLKLDNYCPNRKCPRVVLSLTTMPERLKKVHIAIDSIINNTITPDLIVLYLYRGEFGQEYDACIKRLEKRKIKVVLLEENLRSHKKYIYALKDYPNSIIITIDDDFIYPNDLINNLMQYNRIYPDHVLTFYSRKVKIDKNGKIEAYRKWKKTKNNEPPSFNSIIFSGSGALYPPNTFDSEIFNKEVIKNLSFTNDDIWLSVMTIKNKKKIVALSGIYKNGFISIRYKKKKRLSTYNDPGDKRRQAYIDLMKYYEVDIF